MPSPFVRSSRSQQREQPWPSPRRPQQHLGQRRPAGCRCTWLWRWRDRHRPREVGTPGRGGHRLGVELEHQLVEGVLGVAVTVERALPGSAEHWARNVDSAFSNPMFCSISSWRPSALGSTAPSSTAARTVSGNSVAHVAAELGSVAEPEVADRVLAERLADRVHVTRPSCWCRRTPGCPGSSRRTGR